MTERLILIGFMCSGKSTVGRRVADALDWDFVDFDEVIERRTGKRIVDVFRDHGEGFFRGLEAETTREIADQRHVVLAPGGGWVTQPDLVDLLRADSHIVWLRVGPKTALERHGDQAGVERPLLAGDDPLAAVLSMLSEREPLYKVADAVVETDGREIKEVVELVLRSLGHGEPPDPAVGC